MAKLGVSLARYIVVVVVVLAYINNTEAQLRRSWDTDFI